MILVVVVVIFSHWRFLHSFLFFILLLLFHFNLSRIFFHSFTASATVLSGDFFTNRRFLLYAPSSTFFLHLSKPPWEPAVLP